MDHISRGQLAKKTGVNIETVRYYENIALMPNPLRTVGGHRTYDQDSLKRLTFIRRCRELGFTIDELRELLELVDGGDYSCAEVLQSTVQHLGRIRGKIKDLRKMEKTLRAISDRCSGKNVPDCPIIETLWQRPTDPTGCNK
ncbi:MAG: MerR family mercuric resistance operon transcriptional regulator [Lysobacterales bacterium]|jgi:MerR family mercuric resistance operon transcriptional regulator